MSGAATDPAVEAVAAAAVALVEPGFRVGLGSGRAASAFVARLGERVRDGLDVVGVASSEGTAAEARALGIPLVDLDERELDLTVDGADEVSPSLDLIKGWGGALVRERIVACASRRQVILVGREKLVHGLGERGRIPVEVIPLARGPVTRALRALGLEPTLRMAGTTPFRSDNGNLTIDFRPAAPLDPHAARTLEATILGLAGVVDTGMFLGTAERILIGHSDGRVEIRTRIP